MTTISTLILSLLSAFFYVLGGRGDDGRKAWPWAPHWLFDTKARDIGVALCVILWLGFNFGWSWTLIPVFGATFGAETWSGKPKGKDSKWHNWLLLGLAYGVATIFYAIDHTSLWVPLLIRIPVLAGLVCGWSQLIGKAWLEEAGRGAFQITTLIILKMMV